MKRLRLLFYFTSVGIAIGYFFAFLLFFFVQFEMLADQTLVIFVWTVYGIMTGLYFKRINRKYTFFIIEGIIIGAALITGKTTTLLYIAREVLHAGSLSQIKVPFLIGLAIVNLINIYIIMTLPKYQKVYTKEERKALKEKEIITVTILEEKLVIENKEILEKSFNTIFPVIKKDNVENLLLELLKTIDNIVFGVCCINLD